MSEWVWIQEGSLLHDIFMLRESLPGMFVEWQLASEGSSLSSLLSPSLVFKSIFQCRFANVLWAIPHKVVRTPCTQNIFCFYVGIVELPWQSEMIYSIGWCVYPTLLDVLTSSICSQRFCLSFSFLLCTGVCFTLSISNGHSLSSESMVALQLHVRGIISLGSENGLSCLIHFLQLSLEVEGSLASSLLSNIFHAVRKQARVASWVFTVYFMSQHSLVFRSKALIGAVIMLHLLHVFGLNPSWVFWTGVSGLAATDAHPEFGYIPSQSLPDGIEVLAEGVKHHYNTIIFIQHLQDITQGSILA